MGLEDFEITCNQIIGEMMKRTVISLLLLVTSVSCVAFPGPRTEVLNFQANCSICDIGFSTPVWKGPDEWDFSQIDERVGMILKVKPGAWILPRIYIGTPKWWRDKCPEEIAVLDHGGIIYEDPYNQFMNVNKRPYPSPASKKW